MPKVRKLVYHPDPSLRRPAAAVPEKMFGSAELLSLLQDMEATMAAQDGAGLAAPQIGESIRAVVIFREEGNLFLLNPQITKRSWARTTEEEGCLSVVNEKGEIVYAPVERYKRINCLYRDEKGAKHKIAAEGLAARVIQHEIDHLDGILFLDRLAPGVKPQPLKKPAAS